MLEREGYGISVYGWMYEPHSPVERGRGGGGDRGRLLDGRGTLVSGAVDLERGLFISLVGGGFTLSGVGLAR